MSLYDFRRALDFYRADAPFDALVMAAMLRAHTGNHRRLVDAFPHLHGELTRRYNAAGGLLPGEPGYDEIQRKREALGLPPT